MQIQAQAELIEYLRAITSSQHEEGKKYFLMFIFMGFANEKSVSYQSSILTLFSEGSKGDNYVVSNNSTSDISLTSKSSDISHFDNNKLLQVQ